MNKYKILNLKAIRQALKLAIVSLNTLRLGDAEIDDRYAMYGNDAEWRDIQVDNEALMNNLQEALDAIEKEIE